ncbi:HNH endonuclease signature motif containing protein [Trichococcus sp. K1Tr]|uniref:HNH endonuclease n=1 Tax=Trichococcus sp. K1Tr TaxID=3020847 RepID=UPI0023305363|nr:HNH endonuclease signature motif containing protein [Trichococcus sp. K1Tr]MDB6353555.1 HNH endonuclease signature motif containing protein [Trichococcus sp. K1Tr]
MSRPKISNAIKAEVRKKCYYGCVICGNPIVEYEHIKEWHVEKKHELENLTLLCPMHHSEVTKGLIDKDFVSLKSKNPYNKGKLLSPNYHINYYGDEFEVLLGSNTSKEKHFTDAERVIVRFMNRNIITARFEEGNLLISLNYFDENNKLVFAIHENEMIFNLNSFDIINVKNRFILKENNRTVINIHIAPPRKLVVSTLIMKSGDLELSVTEEYINYCGTKMSNMHSSYNGGAAFNFN